MTDKASTGGGVIASIIGFAVLFCILGGVIISATHEAHTSWTNRFLITLTATIFASLIFYVIAGRQTTKERQEDAALAEGKARATRWREEERIAKERERERIAEIARADLDEHLTQTKQIQDRRERKLAQLEKQLANLKTTPEEDNE